jgi:hypothetical protein
MNLIVNMVFKVSLLGTCLLLRVHLYSSQLASDARCAFGNGSTNYGKRGFGVFSRELARNELIKPPSCKRVTLKRIGLKKIFHGCTEVASDAHLFEGNNHVLPGLTMVGAVRENAPECESANSCNRPVEPTEK